MSDWKEINHSRWQHVVYYEWHMDIRAGGPTGYLANLLEGLNHIPNSTDPLIVFETAKKQAPQQPEQLKKIYQWIHAYVDKNEQRKRFYVNHISRHSKQEHDNYVQFLSHADRMYCIPELFQRIDLKRTKTIHVHTVGDAVKVKNSLKKAGADHTKVILTSHTPEAPSDEYYKGYLEQWYSKERAEQIKRLWRQVERKAFTDADLLVFPCKEAMEPLRATMDGFDALIRGKDIRFVPSGAKQLVSRLSKEEAKKKYGLEGKFVVGYVGRHNQIKGYDILQKAAKKIWKQQKDICFLIGGAQGNAFLPLSDQRWREAGWVDPADLFQALDVFVLPNRMTYFDLVLLEAMSMGTAVIASDTGGNKTVQNTTQALQLFDGTPESLAAQILDFFRKSQEEQEAMRKNIQVAYMQHYTPELFAGRYVELVQQIYADYRWKE